ncbi:hypothetical protein ACIBSW_36580 [Actinoplanes sp. NPDC049668]|uniref:hypothetical protein n=1 Tax=unclassified Actinoplanes TaxID=2626549 RepID=UPI0033A2F1FB
MNTKPNTAVRGNVLAVLGVVCLLVAQFELSPGNGWVLWGLVMLFSGLLLRIEGAVRDRNL